MTSLVKKIDKQLNEASAKYKPGQKLGVFVILPDAPGLANLLDGLAQQESLQRVNLCLGTAPPRYEIAKEAHLTVVIYNPGRPGQQTVTANFALRECAFDETQCDAIVAALAKVLPK